MPWRILQVLTVGLALASAGCPGEARTSPSGGADLSPDAEEPDEGAGAPPNRASCTVDADCEPVASSCCECPTFALPISEGVGAVCEDVSCDEQLECSAQQAVCDSTGTCALACSELVCELSCENGFEVDASGCALCACNAEPEVAECSDDAQCTQVAADCCGCNRGGQDTAVPSGEAASFVDSLDCDGTEVCPEVDVCDASEVPTCSFGRCVLVNPSLEDELGDPQVCGTAEAPTCSDGADCVLNPRDYPMVAAAGLGICQPQ